MIGTILTILLLGIGSICFAADDSQEPPLKYTIEINGQQHDFVLDRPVQIHGTYRDPKVVLRASLTRHFTYGALAFQYPASFIWEAQIKAPDEKSWTLSGNDFKIMYFVLPGMLSVDEYAQALAKEFGKGSTRISDTERMLGGHRHKGKLLLVKLVGTALCFEVYALPARAGSRLLVFQDTPPDNKAISEEGEKALRLLSETFKDMMK
jgi:hypothetical protein